ncbi:Nuclease S1 [Fulvia fulva]|uniref:Nuclease S1 n=1 Tax=Passalora fulva TaxID=5499 RepID=A0A9Q8PJ08_PASFU|nr:Nuclease S1 [Fulvia fulva]KAK4611823.1 Nuclease S1 [Fulvia fulva]KAK4612490.1 Nuclease S1 [Fulvia fulva]UJO23385.1 Nuclease S1 [Fulvia fulva]WPV21008.1 Nuclease S1 [Fulvia fulva]WPV35999.1 Nuclease S1 [Fulvia fulva]
MLSLPLTLLAIAPSAYAWGSLGHETVAYIASHYVKSHTKTWAQDILNDNTTSYLASVATWADSYRYTAAGAFSAPFHYIDAEDNPPSSCSVDYDRDCGTQGCSVSAIANYTTRVQSAELPDEEVNVALKFLVHFLGDSTQPLHDEAYEVGGNDVDVTFDDTDTNLHHIWDTNMPEKLRGGYSLT